MRQAVAIDVGGTTIKGALAAEDGTHGPISVQATPRNSPEAVCNAVAEMVEKLKAQASDPSHVLETVGVCTPGILDDRTGVVRLSVNLGWRDTPIRELLSAAVGFPIALAQDVRCGGLAEATWGAGATEGMSSFYYVAIGTGLGAAIISDKVMLSLSPEAGEIGLLNVPSPDHPGLAVPLESIVSGTGICRRARERRLIGEDGTARQVLMAAQTDPAARTLAREAMSALAEALAPAMFMTGPLPVVLGGATSKVGETLTIPLAARLADILGPLRVGPVVTPASLGGQSQMLGAAAVVFQLEGQK